MIRRAETGDIAADSLSVEASWAWGAKCFTGLMIGIYSTGNGQLAGTPADFDWFDHRPR